MSSQTNVLVKQGFAKWFRTKGFLMVIAVGLIPAGLTAAWVGTHQADLGLAEISWEPQTPTAGDNVTFTATVKNKFADAVGPFNVTIRVGFYQQDFRGTIQWNDVHNESVRIDRLAGDATRTVSTAWTTEPGTYQVEAYADFENDVPEIEEQDNYRPAQIQVRYQEFRPEVPPPPPQGNQTNQTNDTRPAADASVEAIEWDLDEIFETDNVTFTVRLQNAGPNDVPNATVTFQVYRLTAAGTTTTRVFDESQQVDIDANGTATADFRLMEVERGLYATAAFLDTTAVAQGDNESDNVVVRQFDVQRRLVWDEPDPQATAKDFYQRAILLPLHFTLLIPLIGLFYAGGSLQDERSRGNLVYVLTRPVPRWSLPITRFATGFLVALVAVLVGVILTFFLLLGTPQLGAGAGTETMSFFWWPLFFAVVVLFLYSAVFTFVGVISDRPYLVGLLYILGFETLVLAGRRVAVNGQPLVQDWVLNFSLMNWVSKAFAGWDPEAGGVLPATSEATQALVVIVAIGIAALVGAAVAMKYRQFSD